MGTVFGVDTASGTPLNFGSVGGGQTGIGPGVVVVVVLQEYPPEDEHSSKKYKTLKSFPLIFHKRKKQEEEVKRIHELWVDLFHSMGEIDAFQIDADSIILYATIL